MVDREFRERCWKPESLRPDDERDEYQRDKARVIHSSAFRRLQGKTQVMGVGEGDFHRTRLTHSIETGQIGEGIVESLRVRCGTPEEVRNWLPTPHLLTAACLAHDLGHPPFGHAGERALFQEMVSCGGFEGNAQTLRILTKLEKYWSGEGINPTRRLILAILKYPAPYSDFTVNRSDLKPPKCFYDSEICVVDWALDCSSFDEKEAERFRTEREDGRTKHHTLDCSIMEHADDVAYGVHDLEDIVARGMVKKKDVLDGLQETFRKYGPRIGGDGEGVTHGGFGELFEGHPERKRFIGKLVNLFITSAKLDEKEEFQHPLLRLRVVLDEPVEKLLRALMRLTYEQVIAQAQIKQLERRGERLVRKLFRELLSDPVGLIPSKSWKSLNSKDCNARRVCDYIAGMTDPYAEKVYQRLFIPGEGSSHDEL